MNGVRISTCIQNFDLIFLAFYYCGTTAVCNHGRVWILKDCCLHLGKITVHENTIFHIILDSNTCHFKYTDMWPATFATNLLGVMMVRYKHQKESLASISQNYRL